MSAPDFKPPVLTSRAQRAAEDMAERADCWRTAHALISAGQWPNGYEAYDVLSLAKFLAGDTND